jgi:hypothetical protein
MGISTLSIRMVAEPLRTLAQASISGAYMGIGTPLEFPSRLLFVQNLTDATLVFSLDGIEDHFILPSMSNFVFDVTTNTPQTLGCYISVGTRIYVKELGLPSTGSVYVSSFYGSNN